MEFSKVCSNCGQLVEADHNCRKRIKTNAQKKHPSGTWRFAPLRDEVRLRDNGCCQRCRILFGLMNFDDLQVHHIKSWRDYPELAYEMNNLILICRNCNLDLGNSNKLDFLWELQGESNEIPYVL
ncbi:HNH endonuclease [Bacillus cereus]|uniref:HNH endonuclease n=1 Tax=Bacillus cereus TaxID=1396 RepID=UPI000BFCA8AD|nr:HNH endonuclease signature motif containing protein [Bacillus cereus]PGP00600.1 HNH endonuclease [Bacillus cereus]